MRVLIFTLGMIQFCLGVTTVAYAAAFERLNWVETKPSALQLEAMASDEPSGKAVVSADSSDLWIAGKSFIWKWDLKSGLVSRLTLPAGASRLFRVIHVSDSFVSGIDGRFAWQFDLRTQAWRKLDGSFDPGCSAARVMSLSRRGDADILFMTECGAYLLLQGSGQLVVLNGGSFKPRLNGSVSIARLPGGDDFLLANHREIYRVRISGTLLRADLIYTAKSRISGVSASGGYFFAWTAQAIIVFDQALSRQQVVPVLGHRKIQGFGASESRHVVGFSDGSIEMMGLNPQRKWAIFQSGVTPQYIEFAGHDNFVVFSSDDGMPSVFNVTNVK